MTTKAGLARDVDIACAVAKRALESRDQDLKREVELKRAAAELERRRASEVVAATVARESGQQNADADAYQVRAKADAVAYQGRAKADADAYAVGQVRESSKQNADADAYQVRTKADAAAYQGRAKADADAYAVEKGSSADALAKQKEAEALAWGRKQDAEALACMADAYAKLGHALGGPQGLLQYLMIESETYVHLAKANADAVRGLEPKISLWNTGAASNPAGGDSLDAMRNLYQMLPPLMTTIHDQTGITLPEWQFGRINAQQKAMSDEKGAGSKVNAVDRAGS